MFEDRTKFFGNLIRNVFGRPRCARPPLPVFVPAARRRRPKLTGVPPPTQIRRRRALLPHINSTPSHLYTWWTDDLDETRFTFIHGVFDFCIQDIKI